MCVERSVISLVLMKLGEVEKAVGSINQKLVVAEDLKNFECIMYCLPCKSLVVSSCCQCIVGCDDCVKKWHEANSCCIFAQLRGIQPCALF